MKHTKEPWVIEYREGIPILFGQGIRGGFLRQINEILMRDGAKIDFERIVSCVNALAGLNPEAIAELVDAAKALLKFQFPDGQIKQAESVNASFARLQQAFRRA